MWNLVKRTLVCLFLGVVFSSAALAANQHKTHKVHKPTQAVIFVFDSTGDSFASYLSPGKGLWSGDLSLFFPTKRGPEWTLVLSLCMFLTPPAQAIMAGDANVNYEKLNSISIADSAPGLLSSHFHYAT